MDGKRKIKKNGKKVKANTKKVLKKKTNSAKKISKNYILDRIMKIVGFNKQDRKDQNNRKQKKNLNNKRGVGKCARQNGPDDDLCMANIGTVMLYVGNQVTNFMKQKKRTETFVKLIEKKGGKSNNFANTTGYLESACSKSPRYCNKI